MKRNFIFLFLICFTSSIFAQFNGIWEGKDRLVLFEEKENNNYEISIVLKEYYGWYYDRTVESKEKSEIEPRKRNAGTTKNPVKVDLKIIPADTKDTFTLELTYSKSQKNYVPVFINDNKIYLNFFTKLPEPEDSDSRFWKGNAISKGILVSEQSIPENIAGYIIDYGKLFDIRYWKSKMDYSTEKASVFYEDTEYLIPKHLYSGNNNYSCVSGRSKVVRNVQPPFEFNKEDYIFNEEETVFTPEKSPYLVKLSDKNTFEDLIQIINEANSRRKPDPDPIFPVKLPK